MHWLLTLSYVIWCLHQILAIMIKTAHKKDKSLFYSLDIDKIDNT